MRNYFLAFVLSALLLTVASSADKKAIQAPEFAAAASSPAPAFSPGILLDGTLYVAGQIREDLKTQEVPADFEAAVQTRLAAAKARIEITATAEK